MTRLSAHGNEHSGYINVKKSVERPNGYHLLWDKQYLLRRT